MTNPTLVTTPFAENGDKNIIPQSVGAEPQNATQDEGFPEVTQTPISAGGIPPERKDFNGILNLYGQHIVHLNKGLPYEFDAAFATAIGGYPLHARIMLDNGDIVRNVIANNINNPNLNMNGWSKTFYSQEVFAEDFGVTGDGVDCGQKCINAIEFIVQNGGVLTFPSGVVNFGKVRKVFTNTSTKDFKIQGQGIGQTTFKFEWDDSNLVDTSFGKGEKSLLEFMPSNFSAGANSYFGHIEICGFTVDYSDQKNKGGHTFETMQNGADPSPYADGPLVVSVRYADSPYIHDIKMSDIYAAYGVHVAYSYKPLIERVYCFNISANQPYVNYNNEAADHAGGAIACFMCPQYEISNCIAWNDRKFECDPSIVSPNGVQFNGTLCGYIGIFGEFSPIQDASIQPVKNYDVFRSYAAAGKVTSNGIVENCIINGYTFGIKSEVSQLITMRNNTILRCYTLISGQSEFVIEGNYLNALEVEYQVNPQSGMESQRGLIGANLFQTFSAADAIQVISKNTIISKLYPVIALNKVGSSLNVDENTFMLYDRGCIARDVSASVSSSFNFSKNNIIIDGGWQGTDVNSEFEVKLVRKSNILDNTFVNYSSNPFIIQFPQNVDNNVFDGCFYIIRPSKSVSRNIFQQELVSKQLPHSQIQFADVVIDDLEIKKNTFNLYGSSTDYSNFIFLATTNVKRTLVEKNIFQFNQVSGSDLSQDIYLITNYDALETKFISNKIKGASGTSKSINLVNAENGLKMSTFVDNSSDSTNSSLVFTFNQPYGPHVVQNNVGFGTNTMTQFELNTEALLYSGFVPTIGYRMYHTRPVSYEGLIYTTSGWKSFGALV